jgi:DNA polymerase bacteriophage-type
MPRANTGTRVRLFIDIETRSPVPIKHGVFAYAQRAELLLFAYAFGDDPVQTWEPHLHPDVPQELVDAQRDPSVLVVAHNYQFERTVLKHLGVFDVPIERWRCTMALALSLGLPGALGKVSVFVSRGTDAAVKDINQGGHLIPRYCVPKRPGKSEIGQPPQYRGRPGDELWPQFKLYCEHDVAATRLVARKLPWRNLSLPQERELFMLDAAINERGVCVDLDLASSASQLLHAEQRLLVEKTQRLTQQKVMAPTQRDRLLQWFREEGLQLSDMRAGTLEQALNFSSDEVSNYVKEFARESAVEEMLQVRIDAGKTSGSKYEVALNSAGADGRVRGLLQLYGAGRTGRWAGRMLQPQNLPRPTLKADVIEQGIKAIKDGTADLAFKVIELCSNAVRGLIIAPPGRKLVVADLANIEGRVLAWLAGEAWKLQAFRDFDAGHGPDLYKMAYSKAYNKPVDAVADNERQVGKVMELALGFQGSIGAFSVMAQVYGVSVEDDDALSLVGKWRKAHPRIVRLWADLEMAARARAHRHTLGDPIAESTAVSKLIVDMKDAWMRLHLPSKRALYYYMPRLDYVDKEDGSLTFVSGRSPPQNGYQGYAVTGTYGGKLTENATQAVARDVLAAAMPRIEAAGYEIVLTVHDEVICEVPDRPEFNAKHLCELLTVPPSWAADLPLAAKGFETYRYRKD